MKTRHVISFIPFLALVACTSPGKSDSPKIKFGIYETVKAKDLPMTTQENIRSLNIQLEKDASSPIVGYIAAESKLDYQMVTDEAITLLTTIYTIDLDKKFKALVALKPGPVISNEDVKRAKSNGITVEIRFTMWGAKKWADMIQANIGEPVAFAIDGVIYSLPVVNARIDNGSALLSGLPDEETAKSIAESLNASF